jgi:hypothetical protein
MHDASLTIDHFQGSDVQLVVLLSQPGTHPWDVLEDWQQGRRVQGQLRLYAQAVQAQGRVPEGL